MRILNLEDTTQILEDLDIDFLTSSRVKTKEDLTEFADNNFPLFLKVFSPETFHRTEENLVLEISHKDELEEKFKKLKEKASQIEDAFLVAQKKGEGSKLFLGIKKDPVFGFVVMFGMGGILLELIEDVSYGICPLTKEECKSLIKRTKAFDYIKGFRGEKKTDINKLANFIYSFSKIPEKYPEVKEVDFNPVFAFGNNIKVADFKIFV